MNREWISTGEAARLLGVRSVNTVKRLIREGRLQASRPGSHYRVRRTDVERLAAAPTRAAARTRQDPLDVPRQALDEWARRHRVRRLSLFGSAARRQLRPDSDVDLLMDLLPDARVGLFEHVRMARELEHLFGRQVDLGTWASLKPRLRRRVEAEAVLLYEA